ncbi:MAG: transketolase [Holosporales bacterium]|jgi:transketolase|nr:transketolase [Holosporales bacterium]
MVKEQDELKNFANAVRCLSVDMVNTANSGHQGAPLGFADVISVLFNKSAHLVPNDEGRDRLILSNGHASAMLYSALYLTQKTSLTIENLMQFRKFGCICQGHPEINKEIGIEMTTGALGQGIATSVGFAVALKKKNINSKVFVIVGDGDLMEGVSHESMTLAASLNLDNLIILFDDNDICIDGVASSFTTDNIARFKAYGFNVLAANGHDYDEIYNALESAKIAKKPSFIAFKTIIGKGTTRVGTPKCHGKFVSDEDARCMKRRFGLREEAFSIPFGVVQDMPTRAQSVSNKQEIDLEKLHDAIVQIKKQFIENPSQNSTRYFSGIIFEILSKKFANIIGGSADLSESNCTISSTHTTIGPPSFDGNYIHYGVREHAMGCIMNGLAIEGFIPYGGTFLAFSDYMKPAIRNAALMKIAPIFVFTHDSVAVGEDGGTHQPIEQLSSLRLIPNMNVFRPCCDIEVAECIELAIKNRETPSALILSRQKLLNLRTIYERDNLSQNGMYTIVPFEQNGREKLTIIASGSEVSLAFALKNNIDFDVRIVSVPSIELFEKQTMTYKMDILFGRKILMEAGRSQIWYKYKMSDDDVVIGIDGFGESGNEDELFKKFGFTVDNIKKLISK